MNMIWYFVHNGISIIQSSKKLDHLVLSFTFLNINGGLVRALNVTGTNRDWTKKTQVHPIEFLVH